MIKKTAGRPKGSLNKDTFTTVTLEQLTNVLKGNAQIPVRLDFAELVLGETVKEQNNG